MGVTHYEQNGKIYKEVISRNYRVLRDLEKEFEVTGRNTWVNIFDSCAGLWKLTVEE